MPTQKFTLTGSGATGLILTPGQEAAVKKLPTTVHLGRKSPKKKSNAPDLAEHFDPGQMKKPPPTSVDFCTEMAASLATTLGNTQQGDCVIASKLHHLGLWSANEGGADHVLLSTDREALSEYHRICGGGDNGCVIEEVLQEFMRNGISCSGKRHKIDAYAQVSNSDVTLAKIAIWNMGGLCIGFGIPEEWLNSDTWDVTNSRIVGGHDVLLVDYTAEGFRLASWGRVYLMTWAAYKSMKYIDERWVLLGPEWYAKKNLSPSGINVEGLRENIEQFQGGVTPEPGPGEHECPAGQHWDDEQQQCVPDEHKCPPGQHWDEEYGSCVPDAPTPGPVAGNYEIEINIPAFTIKGCARQVPPDTKPK